MEYKIIWIDSPIKSHNNRYIRESELSLAFVQNALDPMIMMDQRGNISFWNPAAERVFGHKAEDVLGHNLHLIIAPTRYKQEYEPALDHFYKTGLGDLIGSTRQLVLPTYRLRRQLLHVLVPIGWHGSQRSAPHRPDEQWSDRRWPNHRGRTQSPSGPC